MPLEADKPIRVSLLHYTSGYIGKVFWPRQAAIVNCNSTYTLAMRTGCPMFFEHSYLLDAEIIGDMVESVMGYSMEVKGLASSKNQGHWFIELLAHLSVLYRQIAPVLGNQKHIQNKLSTCSRWSRSCKQFWNEDGQPGPSLSDGALG